MRICFDMDGTLCMPATGTDYKFCAPVREMIEYVRQAKSDGHYILIYTARGTGTGTDWRIVTERQLNDWGVPYDELIMGKPFADLYVDDRAVNAWDYSKVMACAWPAEPEDDRAVDD